MKWLLSLLFLTGVKAEASFGQLSLRAGTWSFSTENVQDESQSSSGVGAYAFELGYRIQPKWLLVGGVNLIFSDIYQGSSGYGLDLGTKYYPFTESGTVDLETETTTLTIQEAWRPYAGLFFRQRIFGLSNSVSYLGPGVSLGVDYSFSQKWLLNIEYRFDYLYGADEALAIQNNILIGLGLEF